MVKVSMKDLKVGDKFGFYTHDRWVVREIMDSGKLFCDGVDAQGTTGLRRLPVQAKRVNLYEEGVEAPVEPETVSEGSGDIVPSVSFGRVPGASGGDSVAKKAPAKKRAWAKKASAASAPTEG